MSELILEGIDGANPLGFMAALGAILTASKQYSSIEMGWRKGNIAWQPYLKGCKDNEIEFCEAIAFVLSESSSRPFEIDKKLPFSKLKFKEALKQVQSDAHPLDRRCADILCAFGSEACSDDKQEDFNDTYFRMVRSGDAAGQGLPCYAISIRDSTGPEELRKTLFETWNYKDKGFSLRWNPVEDQRYALRWNDPSNDKDKYALGTMMGANALALEALAFFPAVPDKQKLQTTGFFQHRRKGPHLTWPIWEPPISVETIRSLLTLRELQRENPPREELLARGIVEIYRCERIAPNQYYRNFSCAVPA